MALLVAVTLNTSDRPAELSESIVYAALGLATLWTALTWYMARNHPERFAGLPWFIVDLLVVMVIAAASVASNADDFFHGGMPISAVFVGALWRGLLGAFIAAFALTIELVVVHLMAGLGAVRTAGSVIFFIVAWIVGWAFTRMRQYDIARANAAIALVEEQEALAAEISDKESAAAVREARLALVERLHDSVLQTLHAIKISADDPAETRYLSRKQERELRRNIEEWRSEYDRSFRALLLATRDDIEDRHRVEIDAVIRDDLPMSPSLAAGIEAAREAMSNAAKHADATQISLFSESDGRDVTVHIRDNGCGLASTPVLDQVRFKLEQRVDPVGGRVTLSTDPGVGTDVQITVGVT